MRCFAPWNEPSCCQPADSPNHSQILSLTGLENAPSWVRQFHSPLCRNQEATSTSSSTCQRRSRDLWSDSNQYSSGTEAETPDCLREERRSDRLAADEGAEERHIDRVIVPNIVSLLHATQVGQASCGYRRVQWAGSHDDQGKCSVAGCEGTVAAEEVAEGNTKRRNRPGAPGP